MRCVSVYFLAFACLRRTLWGCRTRQVRMLVTHFARTCQQPPARQMAQGSEQEAHGPSSSSLVATTGPEHARAGCAGDSGESQICSDELHEVAGVRRKADESARASPDASTALAELRALASSRRLHLHPTFAYQVPLSLSLPTSAPASFSRLRFASFAPSLSAVPSREGRHLKLRGGHVRSSTLRRAVLLRGQRRRALTASRLGVRACGCGRELIEET